MIRNIFIGCLTLMISFAANAFSIKYADDSPIKNVSLKDATLHIKVYYNGNPSGTMKVKTNAKQEFTLTEFTDQSAVAIDVLSIESQKKHNAACRNAPRSGNTSEILIVCKKVSEK
jgi:hypothetical protein